MLFDGEISKSSEGAAQMKAPRAAATRLIDARPERVYRMLADYHTEHPSILPKPYFASLVVERGGIGAGTVVRVGMRVMGMQQELVMRVTEPVPGEVLQEEDPDAGVTTTFTVIPANGGTCSLLEIASVWSPKPGLRGLAERMLNPPITRRIYSKELDLIAEHLRVGEKSV
jgi:hypothetical protein